MERLIVVIGLPNPENQITVLRYRGDISGKFRMGARVPATFRSSSKKGAEFFAEEEAGAGEGDGEEDHCPDTEGACDVATFAEELEEFVDGFGDR